MKRINGPDQPRSRRLRLDREFAYLIAYFKERAGYLIRPTSLCTLKSVQVILDPTMVGLCARI
jgi:hypothetical protein